MNSKWGNSLAIVARNVRSAWRAILSGYLGSYIQEPEGGGSSQGVSAFCVDELDKLVTHRPPRPPRGRAGQAGYTSSTLSTGSGERCSVYLCTLTSVGSAVPAWALTQACFSLDRRLRCDLGSHSRSRGLCFGDVLTLLVSA